RRRVARVCGQRSHEEQLIRPQVAMKDVAFGDAEGAFEIWGRIETSRHQRALHCRHILGQVSEQLTSQRLSRLLPTFRRLAREELHEASHDVMTWRDETRIEQRGHQTIDPETLVHPALSRTLVAALSPFEPGHERELCVAQLLGVGIAAE